MSHLPIHSFFDPETATFSYIIHDPETKVAAIVDPVLNYDPCTGKITTTTADQLISYLDQHSLTLEWILETHIHADHLTAAHYLKEKVGGKIGIGSGIHQVLSHWVPVFNITHDTPLDGSQFDCLFEDNATFALGNLTVTVLHTPGHTPSCICYWVGDALFVGDLLLMPDIGTARADFPGGDAQTLFQSIQRIFTLPDDTRIFVCHDYPPASRPLQGHTTIAEQKEQNVLINHRISEVDFIKMRNERDRGKPVPKLMYPSLQINLRGGCLGQVENNGYHYLKIPIS
ncbi:MAG TPA: MBL fold metallo-hydrolase [Candidatus Nitrosotenuis sp.]|jgi:glyoxylase-like metal-dependent hydrolase (beta-lactamase superfamily II)|nr:MBL fold metallo-hydrolase [Candidatus Nitrosotenuis sp.]